jgi:hypothetical protein
VASKTSRASKNVQAFALDFSVTGAVIAALHSHRAPVSK